MRARIAAGGREIELDGPGTAISTLAAEALALWQATASTTPDSPETPATFGFSLGMLPACELSQEATNA